MRTGDLEQLEVPARSAPASAPEKAHSWHLTPGALNSEDRRCKTANSAAVAPSAKPARAASAGFALSGVCDFSFLLDSQTQSLSVMNFRLR